MDPVVFTFVPLAIALLLSLGLGRVASRLNVPRVTVYLLVGMILGPQVGLRWLGAESPASGFLLGPHTEVPLHAIEQITIGFILFGIGAEFRFETFREVGARILGISGIEIGLTGFLVGGAVFAGTGDWRLGVIAPALAISSAPSATLVTLREIEAEGPIARTLILCVGHNNLAALLTFPLLLSLAFGSGHPIVASLASGIVLVLGSAVGLAAAIWLESITGRRELVLLGILVVLANLGFVHWIEAGSTGLGMLSCFAAGVALGNASPHANSLFRYLENTVYPLYVLFFIAAGRDLHIGAVLEGGLLGLLFIAARSAGKLAGVRLGLRATRWEESHPPWLGAGLLCQAGIALGLVATLEEVAPRATEELRHIVVASVVFFELVGPWLVRRTVVRAGEVKLANLLPHAEARGTEALHWVLLELRRNLGLLRTDIASEGDTHTVRHAMRRRPRTVSEAQPFESVLKALGETSTDILPVVDAEGRFQGIISYEEVKNTLYDPALRGLVIAEDLMDSDEDPLGPDDSLPLALEVMDRHKAQSWPVAEDGVLRGVVRRTDIYSLMRRN